MSGPIRAKLDGYFYAADVNNNSKAAFKFFWDYLKYLETVGVVTEIARNNGTAATGTGWWDDAQAFGNDAWAVFRWNSSSVRTWEWYMQIQAFVAGTGVGSPALVRGASSDQALAMSVAISVNTSSGVTSNPWGGSGSIGSGSKSNPVWTTGSVGDTLFVFPRSNNISGSHVTSKQNMWPVSVDDTLNSRGHIMSDDDGFICFFSDNNQFSDYSECFVSLVYPYVPANAFTASVKTPLMAVSTTTADVQGLFDGDLTQGSLAGTGNRVAGGIIAADGLSTRMLITDFPRHFGSFNAYMQADFGASEIYTFLSESNGGGKGKWNPLGVQLWIPTSEPQYQGYVGQLSCSLVKVVRYAHPGFITPDGKKIIFSPNNDFISNTNKHQLLVPWTGSVILGKNVGFRDGMFSGSIT